jgi:hypothetical protein
VNIKEARNVFWLHSNYKTLGELLDEGYLNQSRLEWAAEKAYRPELKEAAKIILEANKLSSPVVKIEEKPKAVQTSTPDRSLPIGINLNKAHSTLWPFAPFKGQQMGALVDSRQLSLKDLGFAIETAWDEKVRRAAIALSLVRLEQIVKEPLPDAGYIHIVSGGRSYSERQATRLILLQGVVLGFMLTLMIILIIWLFAAGSKPNPGADTKSFSDIVSTPAGIVALIASASFFIFLAWLINFIPDQISKRLDKKIEEYRFGQDGEDQVAQLISQIMDGNWHLFRNINLPGRNKSDLDVVLVGPPGVWVLEVKNFRGEYRNIGNNWEYRHGKKWKSSSKSPSQQALNSAVRLSNFLKADNVNVFVNAVVVWANEESPLTVENPSVVVWNYNRLADELGNIWQTEKLPIKERTKIVEKLSKLCEAQRKPNS